LIVTPHFFRAFSKNKQKKKNYLFHTEIFKAVNHLLIKGEQLLLFDVAIFRSKIERTVPASARLY